MRHYVYKITDPITRQYYFGSRSHPNPESDDYMGSYYTWIPEDESRLIKEILKDDFKTREDAIEYEAMIIKEVIKDKLNENYHIPNKNFNWYGKNFSDEHKRRLSVSSKGKFSKKWFIDKYGYVSGSILYNSRCDKIRNTMKEIGHAPPIITGSLHHNYGCSKWKYGEQYIGSCSDTAKTLMRKSMGITVYQFSADGSFIKKWDSANHASTVLNIRTDQILNCCYGKYGHKSAGGFQWSLHNKIDTKLPKSINSKMVYQFSMDGILLKEWNSMTEAANSLDIHRSSISRCVLGNGKSAGGYIWKTVNK